MKGRVETRRSPWVFYPFLLCETAQVSPLEIRKTEYLALFLKEKFEVLSFIVSATSGVISVHSADHTNNRAFPNLFTKTPV